MLEQKEIKHKGTWDLLAHSLATRVAEIEAFRYYSSGLFSDFSSSSGGLASGLSSGFFGGFLEAL